ncbi:LOW QUALITY PROTEIN: uncharacterized protein LOC121059468 [Cygnus olor]|uniref:LOW QUALITY PROTEIN: uncharacterized protein LOC121059468 n=1 Tax=Cygnus olor TaxID=8869 RepID=UPI001ADE6265|nr:LOW QUALITY PROTEIN: uncharacterized protein LOC121059468 [Cygnus olor]
MRQGRAAGLAGLAAVLLVAAGRAQVQQEPWAETRDGTGINITCSHPNIQTVDYIHWYRDLPGRGPAFLVSSRKDSRPVSDPEGWLWVAADRRSSALWLAQPRLRDAAVYYCALRATGRGAGAAAGQEPWRAGPGVCGGGEAGAQPPGGDAAPPAGIPPVADSIPLTPGKTKGLPQNTFGLSLLPAWLIPSGHDKAVPSRIIRGSLRKQLCN